MVDSVGSAGMPYVERPPGSELRGEADERATLLNQGVAHFAFGSAVNWSRQVTPLKAALDAVHLPELSRGRRRRGRRPWAKRSRRSSTDGRRPGAPDRERHPAVEAVDADIGTDVVRATEEIVTRPGDRARADRGAFRSNVRRSTAMHGGAAP